MAKNNVLVNGLSAVTSDSSGIVITAPDVCKTTVGPSVVPIPYPNISESKDLADGSTSVFIEGKPVCLESSTFSKSTGDEAGNLKGIASSTGQGEAKPVTFSPTVFIEGKAVVSNTALFISNKGNTPPAPIMQAQVAPAIPPTIEDVELKCPICDKDFNRNCLLAKKPSTKGNHDRDSTVLKNGITIKQEQGKKKLKYPEGHPWYIGGGSLEVHHCIDVASVTDMEDLFKQFQYDINESHNSVVLPADMALACQLAVPRHRGGHGAGRKFVGHTARQEDIDKIKDSDQRGKAQNRKDKQDAKNKDTMDKLAALEKDSAGNDYSPVVIEEGKYPTYVSAVRQELKHIKKTEVKGWECHEDDTGQPKSEEDMRKEFETKMKKISGKILDRIASFEWTISADGRDYSPGNLCGCSNADRLTEKEGEVHKIRGDKCKANRKHNFIVRSHSLKLGA